MDIKEQAHKYLIDKGCLSVGQTYTALQIERMLTEFAKEQVKLFCQPAVSKRLLAEKIVLALDDYGRNVNALEYGLPIDPDTKSFESKRPQEMLEIVMNIINVC